jgi:sodium-independent sulfate anion transporter 11
MVSWRVGCPASYIHAWELLRVRFHSPGTENALLILGTDISVGPTSATALLTVQFVLSITKLAPGIPPALITAVISFGVGIWSLILGVLNLGFVFDLISDPIVDGFMMGIANIVILGQLPAILGLIEIPPDFISQMPAILKSIGKSRPTTIGIGVTGIILLFIIQFVGKKWGHKHPLIRYFYTTRHLNIIGMFTGISFFINKDMPLPVWAITGDIPQTLQPAQFPSQALLSGLLVPSASLAVTVIFEHIAIARSFGRKHGYKIDTSQELVTLGVINVANSMLGGTPVGGGDMARAAVNSESHVRSPLSGIMTSSVVLLSIFALPRVLLWTPTATIAAVTIVSVIEVMPPIALLGKYWKLSFTDFIATIMTFNFTMLASSQTGIGMGLAIMLFYTIFRTMFTRSFPLSAVDLENQHSLGPPSWWAQGDTIPDGTQVISIPRDLMYLNAARIKSSIMDTVLTHHYGIPPSPADLAARNWTYRQEKHITELRKKAGVNRTDASRLRVLVLDMSRVSFIDASGIGSLSNLRTEIRSYAGANVEIRFVGLCKIVKRRFERAKWELENPYEPKVEAIGGEEERLVEKEEESRDSVFEHLPLAIQFQNRGSEVGRFEFEVDLEKRNV